MKLFGSLQNRLMEGRTEIVPVVGMGVTMTAYSDRKAGTVVEIVRKGADGPVVIAVQEDKCTRTDNNGMSENQDYAYEPDPKGLISWFKRDSNKRWRQAEINKTGRMVFVNGGNGLRLGERDAHHDFSF